MQLSLHFLVNRELKQREQRNHVMHRNASSIPKVRWWTKTLKDHLDALSKIRCSTTHHSLTKNQAEGYKWGRASGSRYDNDHTICNNTQQHVTTRLASLAYYCRELKRKRQVADTRTSDCQLGKCLSNWAMAFSSLQLSVRVILLDSSDVNRLSLWFLLLFVLTIIHY